MWRKNAARNWAQTKAFLGDKYHRLGKWAGEMDRVAGVGRRIFALAAPILDDLGHNDMVTEGMKVVSGYDQFRTAAMGVDEGIRSHGSRIAAADIF
jgi:hypothetical protein